jgi:hypothetical protein
MSYIYSIAVSCTEFSKKALVRVGKLYMLVLIYAMYNSLLQIFLTVKVRVGPLSGGKTFLIENVR